MKFPLPLGKGEVGSRKEEEQMPKRHRWKKEKKGLKIYEKNKISTSVPISLSTDPEGNQNHTNFFPPIIFCLNPRSFLKEAFPYMSHKSNGCGERGVW